MAEKAEKGDREGHRPRAHILGVALACGVAWAAAAGLAPAWLDRADLGLWSSAFAWRGVRPPDPAVVVVAMDEVSMEEVGVWPWPRTLYARLLGGLFEAGASAVGLDVAMPQAQEGRADAAFARTLSRWGGRVVLAADFQPLETGEAGEKLVPPLRAFRRVAAFGFVNIPLEADNAIHRVQLLREGVDPAAPSRMRLYPSFDLAIARIHAPEAAARALARGDEAWIDFAGPQAHFPTISASRVLEALGARDRAFLGRFRGRVVLVGATSLRLQDIYLTPFSYMPGVEIHANALHTLLAPGAPHPSPLPWLPPLGLALLAGWGLERATAWRGLGVAVGLAGAWIATALVAFASRGLWLGGAAPLLALGSAYAGALVIQLSRAERARRQIRRTFERYVSPRVVSDLLRNPGMAPSLGGERREVTVMFADVRSFTTFSETHSPEQVVEFLNLYFTEMVEILQEENGCVDKYMGDGILAVWGNVQPLTPEEGAIHAVRAALRMHERITALAPLLASRDYPPMAIGIGLNTGDAVVGNLGHPDKLEFGVVGDSINVASRLEGLTKEYGASPVISQRTRDLVGDRFACAYLDTVQVKGRREPVPIYRVDPAPRAKGGAPSDPGGEHP